jgi:hypothetical protein
MFQPRQHPKKTPRVAVKSADRVFVMDLCEMLEAHGIEPLESVPGLCDASFALYDGCIAGIIDLSPRCDDDAQLIEWFCSRNVPLTLLGSANSSEWDETNKKLVRHIEKPVIVESLMSAILSGFRP